MFKKIILYISVLFFLDSCLYMIASNAAESNKASIHVLIRQNQYDEVEKLLQKDPSQADIIEESILANTPLAAAAYKESYSTEFIKLLLKYGADPNLRGPEKYGKKKELPFEIAVKMKNYKDARLLLDAGTDINNICSDGKSILEKSFYLNEDLVNYVLDMGAVPDNDRMLFEAVYFNGSKNLFTSLESGGLDIFSLNDSGESLLHAVSRFGRIDLAEYLISRGLDVNMKSLSGKTALHSASEGSIKFMNIAGYQTSNTVPVYYASPEIPALLITAGAFVNEKDNNGVTALHTASLYGHIDIVKLLVSAGADVNAVNSGGFTPLHYSAAGIDIDIQNSDYPSYHSVNPSVAEYLIQKGADVLRKTNKGLSPVQVAQQSGSSEDMIRILEKYSR